MAVTDYTKTLPRLPRKTLLMAKLESTYNGNLAPTFNPETDALWIEDAQLTYTSNNQTFNVLQPTMGAKMEVSGNDNVDLTFTVAMSKSPFVSRDQPFGFLFQGCGMRRTAVAAAVGQLAYVKYTPNSDVLDANDSMCFAFVSDKVQYLITGARGTLEGTFMEGGIPKFKYSFKGMFDGAVSVVNITTPEFGYWQAPRVVNSRNSSSIYVGSTLDLTTLKFDGGELYGSKGLSLNLGNSVQFDGRLGGDRMLITDREVTGSVQLDLPADRETVMRNRVRSNTTLPLGFVHGLTDGLPTVAETCLIYGPAVQFLNPKIEDVNSTMYTGFDLRFRSVEKNNDATDNYGDNELSIIFA